MIKLLPIAIIILLVIGVLVYFRNFRSSPDLTNPTASVLDNMPQASPEATDKEKITILEQSVKMLASEIGKINTGLTSGNQPEAINTTSPTTETRVKTLEDRIASLQTQIDSLKGTSPQATSSTSKVPVYIPLGAGGSSNDRNWYNMGNYQITLNPSDYSGYKNMQLEVNLFMNQSIGTTNIRLFNVTDNTSVGSSDCSTTSTSQVLVSSSGFTLPSGSKNYILQVQSTQNTQTNLQSARIKVNF
ncbi:MAG: hypothetical protein V1808_03885 [Candidatus Daviesbacteria bacterium]